MGQETTVFSDTLRSALKPFGRVPFALTVRAAGGVVSVSKVISLAPDTLLPLSSTPRDAVELICCDVVIARGEIVSVQGALTFRVTEVVG